MSVIHSVSHAGPGRSDHRRGDRQRPRLHRRGDGRGARAGELLHQHQGAARLLDRALRRERPDALPGRAHPDASRLLHRHHAAYPERHPVERCGQGTSSSATTPMRVAAPICRTSCSPSRSSTKASWSPGLSTRRIMPISPIAVTPISIRRACASRRSGSTGTACCRRTCRTLILLNCQVPRERLSDLRAQMAANRLGVSA